MIIERIKENVEQFNKLSGNRFKLSLSVGVTHIDPKSISTIEELLEKADALMYEKKRKKKNSL